MSRAQPAWPGVGTAGTRQALPPIVQPAVRYLPRLVLLAVEDKSLHAVTIRAEVFEKGRIGTQQNPVHGLESPPQAVVLQTDWRADFLRTSW